MIESVENPIQMLITQCGIFEVLSWVGCASRLQLAKEPTQWKQAKDDGSLFLEVEQ